MGVGSLGTPRSAHYRQASRSAAAINDVFWVNYLPRCPDLMSGKVPHILPAYCRIGAKMQVTQPVIDMVFRKLGGREVLGQKVTSEADLARLVHGRIPLKALIYVRRGGFSDQEIGRFIIPERTQRHRKAKRQPLTVEESDRVVRLMRLQALAEDVFGDAEKANRW